MALPQTDYGLQGNVLIKDDGVACLSDFGLSVQVENDEGYSYLMSVIGGTPHCRAPEVIESEGSDGYVENQIQLTPQCDMFSYGCLAFEVGIPITLRVRPHLHVFLNR